MEAPAASAPPAVPARPERRPFLALVLAFILALLLVLLSPLAWLAFDVWRVVFNPTLVKSIITDEVVNSDLVPVALEWFADLRAAERANSGEPAAGAADGEQPEPDVVLLMSYLDRDDWRAIRAELLTDEFLTGLVSVTVDEVYRWIDSTDRVPQITWQLQPFKDRTLGQNGLNAINIAYAKLPICTQAEIDDFTARLEASDPGEEILYNLCQFPEPFRTDQVGDYANAIGKVVAAIPSTFELTQQLQAAPDNPQGVGPEAIKTQLRLIRLLGAFAWLPLLILLLLILALAVRSRRGLSRWWGVPLVLGGLLTLLPALAYQALFTSLLTQGPLSETPEAVGQEATRALSRLADQVFVPLLIEAIVMIAVGLGLIVWYMITRPKVPAGPPAQAPTMKPAG
jgi:hypothetical protein